jgi:putative transposase
MKAIIPTLFHKIASALRERCDLSLEMLALRHQLAVLERSVQRPQFSPLDRCVWIVLSTFWSQWPHALAIMQADTVRRWRRQGVRHHGRWPCGGKRLGRPAIASETRTLIRHMSRENILWGAPRIHGELAMLGIKVSRTTVAKYMSRRSSPLSPTWRTCIRNHASELMGREASAELMQRVRALSAWLLMALRCWLDRWVAGEREGDSWYGRQGAVILFMGLLPQVCEILL